MLRVRRLTVTVPVACTRRELQSESCECVTCLDRLHFTAGYIFNLEFPRLDSTEGDCGTLHVDILKLPQDDKNELRFS